jgi:TRAP-type C4-dicarboxylate transport system permease small subunit
LLYKRQKPFVEVFTTLVVIAFFGMMTIQMGKRAYFDWSDKVLLSNSTVPLPTWWVSAIATVGAGVLVLCLLAQLIGMVTRLIGNYINHRQFVREGAQL